MATTARAWESQAVCTHRAAAHTPSSGSTPSSCCLRSWPRTRVACRCCVTAASCIPPDRGNVRAQRKDGAHSGRVQVDGRAHTFFATSCSSSATTASSSRTWLQFVTFLGATSGINIPSESPGQGGNARQAGSSYWYDDLQYGQTRCKLCM